jgi:hypothetical protein
MGVNLITDDSDDMEHVPSVTSAHKLFTSTFQFK